MYYCKNCKENFEEPKRIFITYEKMYGLLNEFLNFTPYEYEVCPFCKSENFIEKEGRENNENDNQFKLGKDDICGY